ATHRADQDIQHPRMCRHAALEEHEVEPSVDVARVDRDPFPFSGYRPEAFIRPIARVFLVVTSICHDFDTRPRYIIAKSGGHSLADRYGEVADLHRGALTIKEEAARLLEVEVVLGSVKDATYRGKRGVQANQQRIVAPQEGPLPAMDLHVS